MLAKQTWLLVVILLVLSLTGCAARAVPIEITWTTESEVNTSGFNVFRSTSRDGEYTQINTSLIPSQADPVLGGKYSYQDDQVAPGQTYYYKLEEVETTGSRTTYDEIVEATAQADGLFGLSTTVWWGLAAVLALVAVGLWWRGRRSRSVTR